MAEHTPGPWRIGSGFPDCRINAESGPYVAKINAGRNEYRANAALAASAPDLLAALEAIAMGRTKDGIQALMDKCRQWDCMPRGHAIPGYGELVTQVARAAIAKARGT